MFDTVLLLAFVIPASGLAICLVQGHAFYQQWRPTVSPPPARRTRCEQPIDSTVDVWRMLATMLSALVTNDMPPVLVLRIRLIRWLALYLAGFILLKIVLRFSGPV